METKYRLFFELVKVSVGNAQELSYAPTEEEWQELYDEATRQTLTGVLLEGVKVLPREQRPPRPLLMNWHSASEQIAAQNRLMNHDTLWVSRKWQQVGYRNVILKGQGNALLYPNPLRRTSGDIDIWLDGNRDEIVKYIKKFFPKEEVTLIEMNFPIKKDSPIEVHFTPSFLYDPFMNRKMQRYFREQLKNTETVCMEDGEINIPNMEMNLVFQLSHIYRHLFFEGIGLRQLMDYYYLLRKVARRWGKTIDDERLMIDDERLMIDDERLMIDDCGLVVPEAQRAMAVIKELKLTKFAKGLMWVLHEVFGMQKEMMLVAPDEREGRFLLKEIMQSGNFGHDDERVGNRNEMNRWERLTWGTRWAMRLIGHYPREVMWHPVYRITQYAWRRWKGYL